MMKVILASLPQVSRLSLFQAPRSLRHSCLHAMTAQGPAQEIQEEPVPTSPAITGDSDESSTDDSAFMQWDDLAYSIQGREIRTRIRNHCQEMAKMQAKVTKIQAKVTNLQHFLVKMDMSRAKRSRNAPTSTQEPPIKLNAPEPGVKAPPPVTLQDNQGAVAAVLTGAQGAARPVKKGADFI